MSDMPRIDAELRTEFGKGAARRARRAGKIPAVLYGHGADPIHLNLPGHDTFLAIKGTTNALLNVVADGKEHLALVKDVQVDPVRREMDHIDLVTVKRGEKVTVEVPILTEGETFGDTMFTVELQTITLNVAATDIPENITVNVEGMENGTIVTVADLPIPAGAEAEDDPETAVIVVSIPHVEQADLEPSVLDEFAQPAAESEESDSETAETE